jgi:hypothetical protein
MDIISLYVQNGHVITCGVKVVDSRTLIDDKIYL